MAEHTEVLPAAPERCFDVVTDFERYPEWMSTFKEVRVLGVALERYPEWMSTFKEVRVLERDADGRPVLVEFRIDAKLREVRYVLRHHLDRPSAITWDYVEGDAKDVDGEWRFEDAGSGTTRCTYRVSFDVGGFIPGSVKRALAEQAVRSSLQALAQRVAA